MFALLLALTAPTTSTKMPPAQALPPPSGEEQAVLQLGQFASCRVRHRQCGGDTALGLSRRPRDGDRNAPTRSGVRSESWTQFTQRRRVQAFRKRISDPAIEIDGDAAMIWAPFVVRIGGKVYNCGIDHFDLVRERHVEGDEPDLLARVIAAE